MTNLYPNSIRIVVLDYALKHWESKEVQEMFSKIVSLKREGYWGIHQNQGMLPVDQTDLIGTHYLVCYETPFGLLPFTGYRSVSLERCEFHRVTFPAISALQSSSQNTAPLQAIIDRTQKQGRGLRYMSSFTKNKLMPEGREAATNIRSIITTFAVQGSQTVEEWLSCSVIKFKMHEYYQYMGAKAVGEAFEQFGVFDQSVILYHHEGPEHYTLGARQDNQKNSDLWNNRIELGERLSVSEPIKKAG